MFCVNAGEKNRLCSGKPEMDDVGGTGSLKAGSSQIYSLPPKPAPPKPAPPKPAPPKLAETGLAQSDTNHAAYSQLSRRSATGSARSESSMGSDRAAAPQQSQVNKLATAALGFLSMLGLGSCRSFDAHYGMDGVLSKTVEGRYPAGALALTLPVDLMVEMEADTQDPERSVAASPDAVEKVLPPERKEDHSSSSLAGAISNGISDAWRKIQDPDYWIESAEKAIKRELRRLDYRYEIYKDEFGGGASGLSFDQFINRYDPSTGDIDRLPLTQEDPIRNESLTDLFTDVAWDVTQASLGGELNSDREDRGERWKFRPKVSRVQALFGDGRFGAGGRLEYENSDLFRGTFGVDFRWYEGGEVQAFIGFSVPIGPSRR